MYYLYLVKRFFIEFSQLSPVAISYRQSILSLVLMCSLIVGVAQAQPELLPLDPLTSQERNLAARLAEDSSRVRELRGSGRSLLISVELADPKINNQSNPRSRHAEVLYYRYDQNQGILALINLVERSVQEVVITDGDSVPIAEQEVSKAIALAFNNRELTSILGPNFQRYRPTPSNSSERPQYRVDALRTIAVSTGDNCYKQRCLDLFFYGENNYLSGLSVTANLSSQTVQIERIGNN